MSLRSLVLTHYQRSGIAECDNNVQQSLADHKSQFTNAVHLGHNYSASVALPMALYKYVYVYVFIYDMQNFYSNSH